MNPLQTPKKLIVLVEDDARLRTIYMAILDKAGYEVRPAPEPDLGLELIRTLPWDLLLLDIMLPVKDGIEVLKQIAQDKLKKGKVVMLTNLNNDNIIRDAFKYGADGYIIKSDVTPGTLVDEIKAFV